VLDLGCGRGELLLLLRETGVAASGVEGDPALAAAAGRRGLEVRCGDVLEVVRSLPDGSRGAVTALHLLEHLPPATLLALLAELRRVLRPGGLLVAECPNPGTLRVGANEFWRDPTHLRPLPSETLALFLRASGFEVDGLELLHPFPVEQQLSSATVGGDDAGDGPLARRLQLLEARLDDLLNGPRDYVLRARRPAPDVGGQERNAT
jgi:O-antigen chain-terminating methyltransferase